MLRKTGKLYGQMFSVSSMQTPHIAYGEITFQYQDPVDVMVDLPWLRIYNCNVLRSDPNCQEMTLLSVALQLNVWKIKPQLIFNDISINYSEISFSLYSLQTVDAVVRNCVLWRLILVNVFFYQGLF